jgi:alpha-1,2-mannosyltransferase
MSLLTTRRIRVHLPVIAIAIWSIWLWDVSGPGAIDRLDKIKGTDFLPFYVSASFVRDGRHDLLYDAAANYSRAQAIAGRSRDALYLPIQGAQTAVLLAPLAFQPYTTALTMWWAVTFFIYAMTCWLLWTSCTALHKYPLETVMACIAFPGLYSTILHGQVSGLGLLCVTVGMVALRRGHTFLAGLAFGSLAFKPHWALAASAIFFVAREWRIVGGIIVAAAAQIAAVYVLMGAAVLSAYFRMTLEIQQIAHLLEPRPVNTLKGLFGILIPWDAVALGVYLVAAAATAALSAHVWRNARRFEIRFSAAVVAMLLISPHAYEYDLILLAPVFFLLAHDIADAGDAAPVMKWSLCALFFSPLLTGLPALIRLQCSVTAMIVLLLALYNKSRTDGGMEAVQLRVAEQYVTQFGHIAQQTNTVVVRANVSDVAGMMAAAMKVFDGGHGDSRSSG